MSRARDASAVQTAGVGLAQARVAIRNGQYHVCDGQYRPLCAPHDSDIDVYDATIADLSDKRLCHRCKRIKRDRLGGGER